MLARPAWPRIPGTGDFCWDTPHQPGKYFSELSEFRGSFSPIFCSLSPFTSSNLITVCRLFHLFFFPPFTLHRLSSNNISQLSKPIWISASLSIWTGVPNPEGLIFKAIVPCSPTLVNPVSVFPHVGATSMISFYLVPWPGIEIMSPTVKAGSVNHLTTREVPREQLFLFFFDWRVIALPHCVGLCHRSTWIRYRYVPSLLNSPLTSHPIASL